MRQEESEKIPPDQTVSSGHGRLGDEKSDGEHPVIFSRGYRCEDAGTSGNRQEEEKNRLPSNQVTLEGDH